MSSIITSLSSPILELYYQKDVSLKGNSKEQLVKENLLDPFKKVVENQELLKAIKALSGQYIEQISQQFNLEISVDILISSQRGIQVVNCSDDRLVEFFHASLATNLISQKNSPIQMQVHLKRSGGLVTGSMRFPHLLLDLSKRFEKERANDAFRICIIGPGLRKEAGYMPTSPQLVEVYTLFPNANYSVLEYNQTALNIVQQQLRTFQSLAYDPVALRYSLHLYPKESSQFKVCQSIKALFIEKALDKETTANAFNINKRAEQILVKVKSGKMNLQVFDVNTSHFSEKHDIVIATLVLQNSRPSDYKTNAEYDHFEIMVRLFEGVKESGTLYVDPHAIQTFYDIYGHETKDKILDYLMYRLGWVLTFDLVNLSAFDLQRMDSNTNRLLSPTLKGSDHSVTTGSLYAVTRQTRTACSAERLKSMKDELDAIQIAFQAKLAT
jgi:hypothetical protein